MPPEVTPPDAPAGEQQPRRPRRAGVIALALVGLALTAGISYAASTLVSQPIGLTSEPATVGDSLAPGAPLTTPSTTTGTTPPATTTVTTTVAVPVPVPVPQTTTAAPSGEDGDHGGDADGDDD